MSDDNKNLDLQAFMAKLLPGRMEGSRYISPDLEYWSEENRPYRELRRQYLKEITAHRCGDTTEHPDSQSYGPECGLPITEEKGDCPCHVDNMGRRLGPHETHLVLPEDDSDETRSSSELDETIMNLRRLGPSGTVLIESDFNGVPMAREDTIVDRTPTKDIRARPLGPSGTVLIGDDFDHIPTAAHFYPNIGRATKAMTDSEVDLFARELEEELEGATSEV